MSEDTREHRAFAAELKFLVTPDQGMAIRDWARTRLVPDPHGAGPHGDRYSTTSLYFDTPHRDVFFRRASHGRAKYRVRRYASSDMVFVERKLRTRELLSKRRSLIPARELGLLSAVPAEWPAGWQGAWFGHRLLSRRLAPVCQVAYDRTARLTPTPYGLARLTVDDNVSAWPIDRIAFEGGPATPVLADRVILELKFRVEMPAVFLSLVETFALSPVRCSKYRLSMTSLGLASDTQPAEPVPCLPS